MMKKIILLFVLAFALWDCAPVVPGPEVLGSGVRFTYRNSAATSVSIAGDFNRWDSVKNPLLGNRGLWSITLPLSGGRYEYRVVVNGAEWVLDPAAPSVDDGMGGRNSVIVVEPDPGKPEQKKPFNHG